MFNVYLKSIFSQSEEYIDYYTLNLWEFFGGKELTEKEKSIWE